MSQTLELPDTTAAWIEYLDPRLDVPVRGEKANAPSFVRVVRTGGVMQTRITDNAQMTFECYAAHDDEAVRLAQDTRSHVLAAAGTRLTADAFCKRVGEVSGPAELPDPDSEQLSRYTFTVETAIRARVVDPGQLRGIIQ
jgi:hypothetical protein